MAYAEFFRLSIPNVDKLKMFNKNLIICKF